MHFLVGYILSLECNWKGGKLNKTKVTKTLRVQSPTYLFTLHIFNAIPTFQWKTHVHATRNKALCQ